MISRKGMPMRHVQTAIEETFFRVLESTIFWDEAVVATSSRERRPGG
jgi:hypothetical protein